jgi:hypothetical protein
MLKRFMLLAFASVGLAACTASGSHEIALAKSEALRPGAIVALDVEAGPEAGNPEHSDHAVSKIRGDLYTRLVNGGKFAKVVNPGEQADYTMDVDLTQVRLIGTGASFFGGAFVAPNLVKGDVRLADNSNGIELANFEATGEAARAYTLSVMMGEHTFDKAVQKFGENVEVVLDE